MNFLSTLLFLGLNGYVYALNKYEDIVVAAKATGNMFLPRDKAEMGAFLKADSLFPALFNFKVSYHYSFL